MVLLTPNILNLIEDAALKSFWRKPTLRKFLRRIGVPDQLVAAVPESESKRTLLADIFPRLEAVASGCEVLNKMARELAAQKDFPDLMGWEDTPQKLNDARRAVIALKRILDEADRDVEAEAEAKKVREKAAKRRADVAASRKSLETLKAEFEKLATTKLGTTNGGFDFEDWFFEVVQFFELEHRPPYRTAEHRQIDGSVTLEGMTYIVELKFEAKPTGVEDTAIFLKKVKDKSDNTMGIMIAASGYTPGAINDASGGGSPLLLFDATHLYMVLGGQMSLGEVISRVRRHSSQYGQAYLAAAKFSG